MNHTTLVSTDTLASHLDGSWVVLDCRFNLADESEGRRHYREAHIPGAQYVDMTHDMAAPLTGFNGRHPLPTAGVMAETFGRLGIGPRRQVVVYDEDTGMYASRFWWMLRYMGHEAAAVLDGGWRKWVREGRPVRAGIESRPPETFAGQPRTEMQLDVDGVRAALERPVTLLVDARAPERYRGDVEPIDRVPGHIPGAVNVFHKTNAAEDGTMLPADSLRARYLEVLGGRDPKDIVMYCGSGVTACHNLLAMEHAGLPGAKLYPGSWSEWSSDPDRPIEKGPPAR